MEKKPITKRWWFWVIIVLLVMGIIGAIFGEDEASQTGGTEPDQQSGQASEPSQQPGQPSTPAFQATLVDGQAGEYGQFITWNPGTDFENTDTQFSIPAGTYTFTNLGKKGAVQISFYKEGSIKVDGHDERIVSDLNPVVIMAGESKTITLGEGDLIVLSDGGKVEVTSA